MTRAAKPYLAWLVWGVAVFAYAVAIINRSSLSALGPATQSHFGIDATTLAMFPMIQLIVYAALQIPVGVLLDRIGPSRVIMLGALLMVAGQIAMATVSNVELAILARIFVGAGDACTFISVMRILPEWFDARLLPTMGQVTGLIGQAGQLISVIPLATAVSVFGWARGFLGVAAVATIAAILAVLVLRDSPRARTIFQSLFVSTATKRAERELAAENEIRPPVDAVVGPPATEMLPVYRSDRRFRVPGASFWDRARRLLSMPGVRLAYWVHFSAQFAPNAFLLLWGTPFLTGGIGMSPQAAAGLLSLMVVSSMTFGMLLGPLTSRFVERRVELFLGIIGVMAGAWTAVLLWPGVPPTWLLIALVIVVPMGGPASMIAFDVVRSHAPRSFLGFGTGLVNTGGFTSGLLVIVLIGLVLDLQGAGSPEHYSLEAFEWAFAVQLPFWALGAGMVLIERRRTGAWMRKHGRKLR
ncbi:MFS transporter [Leucobacter sp. GX24907]